MASATCAESLGWNYPERESQPSIVFEKAYRSPFTFSPAKDDGQAQKANWRSSPYKAGNLERKGDTHDANQDHWRFCSLPVTNIKNLVICWGWKGELSDVIYTSFTLGNTYGFPSSVLYTPTRRSVLLGSVSSRNFPTRAARPSRCAFLIRVHGWWWMCQSYYLPVRPVGTFWKGSWNVVAVMLPILLLRMSGKMGITVRYYSCGEIGGLVISI